MKFDNYFDRLLPGKYFNTVWVALPDYSLPYLKESLSPIRTWCEWCIGVDGGFKPNTIPHITLRYLGYDSEELRFKILGKIDKFREVIQKNWPIELSVGEIFIWESLSENPVREARLNWRIDNSASLKNIHRELLEVEGFSFFRNLEGERFSPHITLGKVNMLYPESVTEIQNYLKSLPLRQFRFQLENFQINMASKEEKQNIRIPLFEK